MVIDHDLHQFITRMPKIELHIHLEGTIRPQTALDLMRRNNPSSAQKSVDDVLQLYRFGNVSEFVMAMRSVTNNIVRLEDLTRVADELFEYLASQNVRYIEFDCAVQKYVDLGFALPDIIAALYDSARRAEKEKDILSRLVINLLRHHGDENNAQLVSEVAALNHPFVVGIGLSGDETRYPQKLFSRTFTLAKEAHIHRTVHAGEALPPDSIWDAIHFLHAERIDHGTTAQQDELLMQYLTEKRIPITQCLSSNIKLNVVASPSEHPFGKFLRRGMLVSLHTDDPQIFNTTITDEYLQAAETFRFSREEMQRIVFNGAAGSFLPQVEKKALVDKIEKELAELA